MPEISPTRIAGYAIVLVAIVLAGTRWLQRTEGEAQRPERAGAAIAVQEGARTRATVHVAGAVRDPGVYRLPPGSRVHDAVRRAGGPTRNADLTQVNLAAELEDGRQVLLPERPAEPEAGGHAPAGGTRGATPAPGVPLNLNTATLEQLDALDGIGPTTAQQILDFRHANNGFGSVDELGDVPGIGEKRLASLREQVRV